MSTQAWLSGPQRLLLRLPEVCEQLAIGKTKLRQLIDEGELPVVQVGRGIRIPARAVDRWVQVNTKRRQP